MSSYNELAIMLMKQTIALLLILIIPNLIFSQNRKDWTQLDYLNFDKNYPFETEKDISGLFFITPSITFDYYTEPIIVFDQENNEILRLRVGESDVITCFNGQKYNRYNTKNPLSPWLLSLSPDYFSIAFECIETNDKFYIVRLNDDQLGYIKKDNENFTKETVEEFVVRWTSLGFDFDRINNPLRAENSQSAKIITNELTGKYKIWTGEVLEMKGDWLKIKSIKEEIGWIKWREGEKILIRMYYAC
ncbi:hypothetical protein [Patiriisocius marinus]|uniref:hypothetical protein n=1 Tax=Patiriisocius marinus TaxID=1397112 RepID=UPI00232EB77A|nr:hypothetical protein [Patiriisocius marinus]